VNEQEPRIEFPRGDLSVRSDRNTGLAAHLSLDKPAAIGLLRTMLINRHADAREQSLMRQGQGWFHIPTMGHEATAAAALHLRAQDYCFPMYRDRGFVLARGLTARDLALDFFAKRTSSSGGRQLPNHFSDRQRNIWSHPSPSGSHMLPACGAAWNLKRAGGDDIVVAHIGDAATRQGDFYEAVCIASELKLPILIMVEDNGYGISTPTAETNPLAMKVFDEHQWTRIDGRDIQQFHRQYGESVDRVRQGEGPAFVWAEFDRMGSHTNNDDQRQYRSPDDLAQMAARDPLKLFVRQIIAKGFITQFEVDAMDSHIRDDVRAEYRQASREADPTAADAFTNVLAEPREAVAPPIELASSTTIADAMSAVFRAALKEDERVLLYGEDIEDPKGGVFKLTQQLSTEFPGRVVNSPLAESTIIGMASGLASTGMRPVFEIQFIDFISTAWNQLITNLSTLRWRSNGDWTAPCVLYAPYGAYLPGGAIWHSQANEASLAHFPGMCVAIPSTPQDAAGLFWSAMHADDPVLILLPKHLLRKPFAHQGKLEPVALGTASVVRTGHDITLVAWGNTVEISQQVAEQLEDEIDIEVLDLRSIVPWDRERVLASVAKTGRLVVVQEDTENCSVGQMVITAAMQDAEVWSKLRAAPQLVSKSNLLIGFHPNLEFGCLPSVDDVITAVRKACQTDQGTHQVNDRVVLPVASIDSKAKDDVATTVALDTASSAPSATTPSDHSTPGRDVEILVPHLGEGIYSGEVVELLRAVGDYVLQDEPICEIESEKATMTIEASHDGQLVAWDVAPGTSVNVGQAIARICVSADDEELATEVASPSDTVAISTTPSQMQPSLERSKNAIALTRAVQVPTAAVNSRVVWETVRRACGNMMVDGKACSPTSLIAWCLTQACRTEAGERFISNFSNRDPNSNCFDLGIAVSLPDDELATAIVSDAGNLTWPEFQLKYREAVVAVRDGEVHDRRGAPIQLSTLGGHKIEQAHPLVVPPAIATFFVGEAHYELIEEAGRPVAAKVATLIMSFDHRLVNGVGAASFINEVRSQIEASVPADSDQLNAFSKLRNVA
jgi:2-oxoisovalerate dehydrogenase E1 component